MNINIVNYCVNEISSIYNFYKNILSFNDEVIIPEECAIILEGYNEDDMLEENYNNEMCCGLTNYSTDYLFLPSIPSETKCAIYIGAIANYDYSYNNYDCFYNLNFVLAHEIFHYIESRYNYNNFWFDESLANYFAYLYTGESTYASEEISCFINSNDSIDTNGVFNYGAMVIAYGMHKIANDDSYVFHYYLDKEKIDGTVTDYSLSWFKSVINSTFYSYGVDSNYDELFKYVTNLCANPELLEQTLVFNYDGNYYLNNRVSYQITNDNVQNNFQYFAYHDSKYYIELDATSLYSNLSINFVLNSYISYSVIFYERNSTSFIIGNTINHSSQILFNFNTELYSKAIICISFLNNSDANVNFSMNINHVHNYTYIDIDDRKHRQTCSCGHEVENIHAIRTEDIVTMFNLTTAPCYYCRRLLILDRSLYVILNSNNCLYSQNGSILVNGLFIIIDDDDIELYEQGVLVFNEDVEI